MLKIWGRTNSLNVQKVLLCVEEIGLSYERLDAGLQFGVNDTPAYRALNPNGLVPTIEDDGFILWESNSITRYLAARHAPDVLWPRDPQRRAEAERWMDWQLSVLNAAINPAFVNLIRTPPEKRDAGVIEKSRRDSDRVMAILDSHLANRAFVAAERFTIAECALAPFVHRWLNLPMAREPRPNVERWYASIMQRPAARKILILPLS